MNPVEIVIGKLSEFLAQSVFFGVGLSVLGYQVGLLVKSKLKTAVANPLLVAILFVILCLWLTGVDYGAYSEGAWPLSYLLTPATVCLAIPLYTQFGKLRRRWGAVLAGIAAGALVNLFCVYLFSLLFRFSREQYVTLLPKSVTTAIGMVISGELGGIPSVTVAAIILTGIFGHIMGEHILRFARVTDPVARGIAIGTGSHAIGTARALELGETEGAMSSLSIVLTGILTVILAPLFAMLM
ncbi:MAG: LrgB family protein [Oscillospiraceae bacterium]|nr:LrgB family protein [Oscillospiraceae bacterium]